MKTETHLLAMTHVAKYRDEVIKEYLDKRFIINWGRYKGRTGVIKDLTISINASSSSVMNSSIQIEFRIERVDGKGYCSILSLTPEQQYCWLDDIKDHIIK